MIQITLYTKSDCHLCEEVKAEISALAKENIAYAFILSEIDITQDHHLFTRFRYIIPVLRIGQTTLLAPINREEIMKALETAVS
jgi:glutaredoxin